MKRFAGTFFLLITCVATMVVECFVPGAAHVLSFRPSDGLYGWLGLLTYQFDHGGWDHLIGNFAFGLPFLAYLETRIGRKKLIEFYLGCGAGSALLNLIVAGPIPLIGSSGSIFGCMVGACLAFGETIPEHVVALLYLTVLLVEQLAMTPFQNILGVAFWGHVGGALTALLLAHRIHKADPTVGV